MSANARTAWCSATLLAAALSAPAARADLDDTLDVSLQATRTRSWLEPSGARGPEDALGLGGRLGATRGGVRFGGGLALESARGFTAIPPRASDARGWLLSAEGYLGYAPGSYWHVRPVIELRAHVERVEVGDASPRLSAGFGPRLGVIVALSEYFFFEVGVGRDLVGPQEQRVTVAIGLPIPLSHL